MEEDTIMEIWDTFKEYIPDKNKETAAHQYIDYVLGKDVEIDVLESFMGFDSYLDIAIKAVVAEASEWEEADEESDYYEDEE
jgi:hypothetical protein